MIRWIALLSVLWLSGCVTTREVVYRDGYYRDGAYVGSSYSDDRYYRRDDAYVDGSYYSSSRGGSGDYYYQDAGYAGDSSWYVDYPAYYSVFWPMYRSWYDPYSYPGYYYGVTYFPRNYLSISFNGGWGYPYYGHYYSPYRYSWADNYYDWRPWYGHRYGHYYGGGYGHGRDNPRPRYGSARNEAERLSHMSDGRYGGGVRRSGRSDSGNVRDTAYGRYGTARDGSRDADYSGRAGARQDPGSRGFGVPAGNDVRRTAYGDERRLPDARGFGVTGDGAQVRRSGAPRGADAGDAYRGAASFESQRQVPRYGGRAADSRDTGVGYSSGSTDRRRATESYSLPRQGSPRVASGYDGAAPGGYTRSAEGARGYQTGPSRSYDAGPMRNYSPAPREAYTAPAQRSYPAPNEGRGYSAPSRGYDAGSAPPAPRYDAPRSESRQEFRSESSRGESRGGSESGGGRGGVRRTGSNRDD